MFQAKGPPILSAVSEASEMKDVPRRKKTWAPGKSNLMLQNGDFGHKT